MSTESWCSIPSLPGYEASSCGRIRSVPRIVRRSGHLMQLSGKVLTPQIRLRCGKPVCLLVMVRKNSKNTVKRVHQLVLEAFLGPCPKGLECCHNDGNPLNNVPTNLRWDLHSENIQDAIKHGTHKNPPLHLGEKHPGSKLTVDLVKKIKAVKTWPRGSVEPFAEALGLTRKMVDDVRKGITWTHVIS